MYIERSWIKFIGIKGEVMSDNLAEFPQVEIELQDAKFLVDVRTEP